MSLSQFTKNIMRLVLAMTVFTALVASFFASGVADAHLAQHTLDVTPQSTPFIPLWESDELGKLSPDLRAALLKVPQDQLNAARNAYLLAKKHPDKVRVETYPINLTSTSSSASGVSLLSIPGIGEFTLRIYLYNLVPYGIGLYFPLATATNLLNLGTGVAATISAYLLAQYPVLTPFVTIIAGALTNVLTSLPNFIISTCGAQGGGFTVTFTAPNPVSFCGPLPAIPY